MKTKFEYSGDNKILRKWDGAAFGVYHYAVCNMEYYALTENKIYKILLRKDDFLKTMVIDDNSRFCEAPLIIFDRLPKNMLPISEY